MKRPVKRVSAYTPDYDFLGWQGNSNQEPYTPCLVGNYYWTGGYIFWIPDVSNLDEPTYGFQVADNEAWSFTSRDNWLKGSQSTLQAAFIQAVNNGEVWEPLTDLSKYCFVVVQHGKQNIFKGASEITTHPVIKSVSVSAPDNATQGEQYNYRLIFTTIQPDWDMSYKQTYSLSGAGSAGLVIDSDGNISGTPTTAGAVNVYVSVTDTAGNNVVGTTSFSVIGVPNHLTGVTASIDNTSATVGTAYTGKLTATPSPSDDGSYSYTYSGNSNGLTIDSTGSISGTPTAATTTTFTVKVVDSYNKSYSATASITVNAAAAVITSVTLSPVEVDYNSGDVENQTFTATCKAPDDGSYKYAWSWSHSSAGTLTPSSDGKSCTLTGTAPTTAGTYIVVCTVTDSAGHVISSTSAYGKVVVTAATPTGEHIQSVSAVSQGQGSNPGHPVKGKAFAGRYLMVTPSPADDGTYKYNWYWSSGKAGGYNGMTMTGGDTYQVYWSGTPTESGAYTLSCDVTDVYNKTVTGTGTLQVDAS